MSPEKLPKLRRNACTKVTLFPLYPAELLSGKLQRPTSDILKVQEKAVRGSLDGEKLQRISAETQVTATFTLPRITCTLTTRRHHP